jgi:hypothetical protein
MWQIVHLATKQGQQIPYWCQLLFGLPELAWSSVPPGQW